MVFQCGGARFHDPRGCSTIVHGRCYLLVFGFAKGMGCYRLLMRGIMDSYRWGRYRNLEF